MRALRVDKMTYAALEATLVVYAAGRASTTIPIRRMLTMTADDLRARAEATVEQRSRRDGRLARRCHRGRVGDRGGSAPGVELPTWLVAIERDGTRLRHSKRVSGAHRRPSRASSTIARTRTPRTLAPAQDALVLAAIRKLSLGVVTTATDPRVDNLSLPLAIEVDPRT